MENNYHNKYWVEATKAVKTNTVIGYAVWHINNEGARESVQRFRITKNAKWQIALHLANESAADYNKGIL